MTATTSTPVVNGQSEFIWYYHPDHLGSTGFVTDQNGELYEHVEYFPFGETWVQEHSNTQRTPYLYTGKELDEETGLYYYGARYYDPRTSVWSSVDPVLGRYLNGQAGGGVYRSTNLGLYTYTSLNPIKYRDPDGRWGVVGHQYTPQAAALAAGVPSQFAAEFGRAAQAPDQPGDPRDAMSGESLVGQFGRFDNQQHIHNLNGGNANEVQAKATQEFKDLVNSVQMGEGFEIGKDGEKTLHGFGDSFGHVRTDGSGQMYSSGFGHAIDSILDWARGIFGLAPMHNPDNPYVNNDQYRNYLGGLYDGFSARAQKEGWKAKMGRQEFVDYMMGNIASLPDQDAQKAAAERAIGDIQSR